MVEKEETKETLVGRICIKLAGRDAGQICVVVEELKDNYILIDGSVRRRKCNLRHVELLPNKAEIKTGAEHGEIVSALKKVGITIVARKEKVKKEEPTKKDKKAAKKEEKKKEKKVKKAKKPTLVPEKKVKAKGKETAKAKAAKK